MPSLALVGLLAAASAFAGGPPPACQPATGTWCNRAGLICSLSAGQGGTTACNERESSTWSFNEGQYCRGCDYTFYVLVECGREMHLPVSDMEGMDLRVTNVVTGRTVPLRCVNQTARADAGLGAHPVLVSLDCGGGPGAEQWWGPAFDETDSEGPGHVAWGDPGCPDLLEEYDADGDTVIECAEVPPGGGVLDLLSPGEEQVMDCFLAEESGLCGLYRVDVSSGGFVWQLFSNCDGSANPQFDIFFDCTEAWAAFAPLPELALDALTVSGTCPDVDVEVTVRNIGCTDVPGDVDVELSTDCATPDRVRVTAAGPIPAGGSVIVRAALPTSCPNATVTAVVDPSGSIAECTESTTVAACRAEEGINSLSAPACGCTPTVLADAGPDRDVCGDLPLTLTGASASASCAGIEHRWVDGATLLPLTPWRAGTELVVDVRDCTAPHEYVFEARCGVSDPCPASDSVRVTCVPPPAMNPMGDGSCLSPFVRAALNCGVPGVNLLFMDLDTSADFDGDGDPTNDRQVELACNVSVSYPAPGYYTFRVWAQSQGCIFWADALVDVNVLPFDPEPFALSCPGEPVVLDCGVSQPGVNYHWDLDVATDSDGNTRADDDADVTGCVVSVSLPPGTYTVRSVAVEDREPACLSSARLTFDVSNAPVLPEVLDLRLARAGTALVLRWSPLPSAEAYRVVRGDVGTWYSHHADDPAGAGACELTGTSLVDGDDAAQDGAARYYLVGALTCGGLLGSLGDAWDGAAPTMRPPPSPPPCP